MQHDLAFVLNGKSKRVKVEPGRPLLWVLRTDLGLTGVKYGCGAGYCGACTVLVNGEPVRSCGTPCVDVWGKRVVTIEALAAGGQLHPVQKAFVDHNAFQCGFCTPGMILTACALLMKKSRPTLAEIAEHMEGNLCRCGSHTRIIAAIQDAAGKVKGVLL